MSDMVTFIDLVDYIDSLMEPEQTWSIQINDGHEFAHMHFYGPGILNPAIEIQRGSDEYILQFAINESLRKWLDQQFFIARLNGESNGYLFAYKDSEITYNTNIHYDPNS